MPFFRRNRVMGTTRKHEITWSNLAQNAATTIRIVLAKGTEAGAITDSVATEVKSGSHVRWLYFEFHFSAQTVTNPKVVHWVIMFEPFGSGTQIANSYQQVQRRNIIKRGMEMLPADTSTVFKRVFAVKVPRKMQRLGIDDELTFSYQASSTEGINACGFVIYKAQGD